MGYAEGNTQGYTREEYDKEMQELMHEESKELINNIRMAMLRLVLDIPDETMEKALEKTINDIMRDTTDDINKQMPESHCETCAYESMEESQYPCNECMYSHKNMWRHK